MKDHNKDYFRVLLSWSISLSAFYGYMVTSRKFDDYDWLVFPLFLLIIFWASKLRPQLPQKGETHYGWCIAIVIILPLSPWVRYYMDINDIDVPVYIQVILSSMFFLALIFKDLLAVKSKNKTKIVEQDAAPN